MLLPPVDARTPGGSNAKAELRARVLQRRRKRGAAERELEQAAICAHLTTLCESTGARCAAAYAAVGAEPSVDAALDALAGRGVRIILPVLQEGLDLDWSERPADGAAL